MCVLLGEIHGCDASRQGVVLVGEIGITKHSRSGQCCRLFSVGDSFHCQARGWVIPSAVPGTGRTCNVRTLECPSLPTKLSSIVTLRRGHTCSNAWLGSHPCDISHLDLLDQATLLCHFQAFLASE